ncbi:tyrosine-type recombinase/integrase [Streptomyces sp. NPDC058632]|uniref:tyrosine-type recombinase/integrase n=1 Tax=unclassified Streptomyces TaxID=2593676 RepID=UPI003669B16E
MKREALVPIDEEIHKLIIDQQQLVLARWTEGCSHLFPRPTKNPARPLSDRELHLPAGPLPLAHLCEVRDEHGRPAHCTPHQWRHTLGTRMINRDVPQEVVRRILDHDTAEMTAHYARLHDTTVREHREKPRKVNISGQAIELDPDGRLAEAAWSKQRLSGPPRPCRTATEGSPSSSPARTQMPA